MFSHTTNRRRFLHLAVVLPVVSGCLGDTDGETDDSPSDDDTTPTAEQAETDEQGDDDTADSVEVSIENVGASAWEVVRDESGSVAPAGEENPTMTFETGRRYVVQNGGWGAHPFALRSADDTPLVSQSANGEYEADGAVEWVDDGDAVRFTVTAALASDLDYYICTVHASMRGNVETG